MTKLDLGGIPIKNNKVYGNTEGQNLRRFL